MSIACVLGCGGQDHGEALAHMAVIDESVEGIPNNAISALFTTHATGAGTVRIEIGGEPTGTRVSLSDHRRSGRLPMNGAGFFDIYRASRIASLDDLR